MAKAKRKIKASEFLSDMRDGLGRNGLRRKYGLSNANLERVTDQIVKAGLLDRQTVWGYLDESRPPGPTSKPQREEEVHKSGPSPPRIWTPEEINALRGQVGISSHVEFVSDLLVRHELDRAVEAESQGLLDKIRLREKENRLFLGVIGEFSSGKSTLINALIRDDLLRADVLQATTAAATELHHGTELNVEVHLEDGSKKSFLSDRPSLLKRFSRWRGRRNPERQKINIRDFIHTVTAEEDVARHVTQVKIYHPSGTLGQGMVIVDTPGTNADNKRHVVVTQWAIREICDAALVVIPADIPVSQTLVNFLMANLSDVLHRCVFIVTKLDAVRPHKAKTQERQIESVRARLKSYLGLDNPLVLGCAPLLVVDDLNGDRRTSAKERKIPEEVKEGLDRRFQAMEEAVWSTLRHQKLLIQLERLSALMSQLLSKLDQILTEREKLYTRRHEELERNKITDLWDFVKSEKTRHGSGFTAEVRALPDQAVHVVRNTKEDCLKDLKAVIYAFQNKDELKSALESEESGARAIVDKAKQQMESRLTRLANEVNTAAQNEYDEFMREFSARYESLATLGGTVSEKDEGLAIGAGALGSGFHRTLDSLRDDLGEEMAFGDWAGVGGGIGGLVLGGLVFGPLGAIVAGGIGALLALIFSPSLDELKEKCWLKLEAAIKERFEIVERETKTNVNAMINSTTGKLNSIIDKYYREYELLVKRMIDRDEREKEELKGLRQTVIHDRRAIKERREGLDRVRAKLRGL